jgi:hypothetical protein
MFSVLLTSFFFHMACIRIGGVSRIVLYPLWMAMEDGKRIARRGRII